MSSETDICNLALGHLGDEATVSSIDPPEGSAQAEHCARFYPIARRAILSCHTWNFNTRRANLAVLGDTPPAGWAYAYALPNPCLKAVAVYTPEQIDNFDLIGDNLQPMDQGDFNTQDFVIEARSTGAAVLYTNVEDAVLLYLIDVTDTTKFSALFELALSRLLASFLAGPVIKGTEGMKVAAAHRDFYEKKELPDAKSADGQARQSSPYRTATPAPIKARQ